MKRLKKIIHSFFVPHEGNNFRAVALHHSTLFIYVLFALTFALATRFTTIRHGQILGIATDISVPKLYELSNMEREKNNLPPLTLNQTLSQAALDKAKDMFEHDYWAHYSPTGTTPWDFFRKEHYNYEYAGENLAKNFLYSQNVVDAWMNSPGHKENLLRPDYSEVGYAVVNGKLNGEETTLVVQFFGKPLGGNAQASAPQENAPAQPEGQRVAANVPQVLPAVKPAAEETQATSNPLVVISLFIGFLILTTVLDLYFASHLKVFRLHGKNLAHTLFLIFFLTGLMIFISRGTIL